MPALLLLNPYVDAILALALAWLSLKIVQALFGPLEGIPAVGSAISHAEHAIAQAVSNACGKIAGGVSAAVGGSLHVISRLTDWVGRTAKSHAAVIAQTAGLLAGLYGVYHNIRRLVHRATTIAHGATHGIKRLSKEYHGIEHRVRSIEHWISKGIGADILPRIKSLDRELAKVEHKVIPKVEADAAAAEADVAALGKWVREHALFTGTAALTGAVAWALSQLGLGGLNCNSNPFKNNRNACGLWSDLADLLALATAVLAVEDFEKLVREMQAVEGAVIGAAEDLFGLD